MKNWKTYQLSKQLVYFPGEVFCEVFRGSVPVRPKYPYSMQHSFSYRWSIFHKW